MGQDGRNEVGDRDGDAHHHEDVLDPLEATARQQHHDDDGCDKSPEPALQPEQSHGSATPGEFGHD